MIKIVFVKRVSSGCRSDVHHVLHAANIYSWSTSATLHHCWRNMLSDKVQWSHCVCEQSKLLEFRVIFLNDRASPCPHLSMEHFCESEIVRCWQTLLIPWTYPMWLVCCLWWRNHTGDTQFKSTNWNIPCSMLWHLCGTASVVLATWMSWM